ncbi:Uncharacterised protein [Vibrio cholerae]|uniref:Uncharacterized protein n=1 Tax=Vibrio cholerae TaxID=666 RepID=A0A655T4U5_VIBCL|nr:Uncharacterised protein [Vibrio cholerae]CSB31140.1 Uncharacterised protein [Vibrio cholerae]
MSLLCNPLTGFTIKQLRVTAGLLNPKADVVGRLLFIQWQ